jgi:predicted RNA-binding Zn ribbon-like protein
MTADLVALARDDLCLAFVNTLAWRGRDAPVEALRDGAALLDWIAALRPVPDALRRQLRDRPAAAAALLAAAVALRESIGRIFARLATGGAVPARDLAALNRALAAAPARAALGRAGAFWAWRVAPAGADAAALLAPVLWSAGDLLAGPARGRVRCCANPECRWLFLDQSKGATRRWCDMASCGNRAKARRHYLKVRDPRGGHTRRPSGHGGPTDL